MNGDSTSEDRPVERAAWPPPLASRAIRRSCKPHMLKSGYCALCGTKVVPRG